MAKKDKKNLPHDDPKQGNYGLNDPSPTPDQMKKIMKKIEKGEIKIKKG